MREYFVFKQHSRTLRALQQHYCLSLENLRQQQYHTASAQEQPRNMPIINRTPSHLKKDTLHYLDQAKLSELAKKLDTTSWTAYTDHLLANKPTAPPSRQKGATKQEKSAARKSPIPRAIEKESIFIWPIEPSRFWLSSLFGPRKSVNGRFHRGIDMACPRSTPIRASAAGRVIEARYSAGYGNTIVINHTNRYKTRYAHMENRLAKTGQRVKQGEVIGTVGDTGFTITSGGKEGTHLHFELHHWGKLVNPLRILPTI